MKRIMSFGMPLIAVLALLSAPLLAGAEGGKKENLVKKEGVGGKARKHAQPCRKDVETFCKDVEPGGGRIVACLMEHKDELSAECRALKKKEADRAGKDGERSQAACAADKEKFCKDVEPGEGRIIKCMLAHGADLSPDCAKMMEDKGSHGAGKNP